MKTIHKIHKIQHTLIWLGMFLLIIVGCDNLTNQTNDNQESFQLEGLNINLKYSESYDQTETTFSRVWPEGVATSFSKRTDAATGEYLTDYEATKQVWSYDEDGYIHSTEEYIDGDGEMNMPESIYNDLAESIPSRTQDYDPVVRTEFINGTYRQIGKSGNILSERAYDKEIFRIPPDILDSLQVIYGDSSSAEQSVQQNINKLKADGINFSLVGGHFAKYDIEPGADLKNSGITGLRILKDLKTGKTKESAMLNKDGLVESYTVNGYQFVNGVPILNYSQSYSFSDLNGEWAVTERTVLTRTNIQVTIAE